MATKKSNNDVLVIAIVIVVVVALVWIGIAAWGMIHGTPISNIQDLPISQVPPAMPQGIVLASDAHVLHSYTAALPQGTTQSALIYSTQQSPTDLLQQYNQYLLKDGWWPEPSQIQIVAPSQIKTPTAVKAAGGIAQTSSTNFRYVSQFSKASTTISVNILPNTNPNGWLVSINMNSPQ